MEKLIKIDSEKLRNAFKRRGLTASEVSQEMGYSRNFLSKHLANGTTTKTVVLLLEKMYNLPLDDYKVEEPAGQISFDLNQPEQKIVKPVIDYDELENRIYKAVYQVIFDMKEFGIL